jgi:HlyD family secretion protein
VAEIRLPVGVEASIDVISGQASNAVLIPVEALHSLSDGSYTVFVMTNGKPALRSVTVGLKDDTYAEIESGLKAGEVVTTGVVETKQ